MTDEQELKSELGRLEAQLRDIIQNNTNIEEEIAYVTSSMEKANEELLAYNKKVQADLVKSKDTLKNSSDMMLSSLELQLEIENIYHSFKNIEDANKKIREIQDDLYYLFNDCRMVRRVGQALIDSFDVSVVSDDVLEKSIEKKQLVSPDYWLTAATVAILYWKKDNKSKANKAIKTALDLDEKNTCIFFMIFNLMMNRDEAAENWFRYYQKGYIQSSDNKTFLMLMSLMDKRVNEDGRHINDEIKDYVSKQLKSKESKASEDDMIKYVTNYFIHLDIPEVSKYKHLSSYCPEMDEMNFVLNRAKNNGTILNFINSLNNIPKSEKNNYLKNYLDDLIMVPSDKEKEKYEEIKYNEEIIRLKGDINQAKVNMSKKKKADKDPLNLSKEMIGWIFDPKGKDISSLTVWNMFALTKGIQIKAAMNYFESYRTVANSNRKLIINDYVAVCDLENYEREDGKVSSFYEKKKNGLLRRVSILPAIVSFIITIVGLCGGIYYSRLDNQFAFLGFVIALGFIFVTSIYIFLYNRKRTRIKERISKEVKECRNILNDICNDYKLYMNEYEENDAVSEDIIEALNQI